MTDPSDPRAAPHGRVAAALLVAWATVSSSALFIVWAAPLPSLVIAAGREAVTALAWTLIALAGARRAARAPRPPQVSGLTRRAVVLRVVASGVILGAHFAGWVGSVSLTTVTHAAVFVSLQPLFAGLFGLALGDRATWRLVLGVAVAVGGSLVMTGGDHGGDGAAAPTLLGDGVAVAAAAAAALYLSVNRGLAGAVRLPVLLAWVNGIAALTIALAAALAGSPWGHPDATWGREGLAVLWLGLAPGLLGHGLMNWSARHVPVHVVSVAVLLEPVGAAVLALTLLGQTVGPREVLGGALLIGGAGLVTLSSARRVRP